MEEVPKPKSKPKASSKKKEVTFTNVPLATETKESLITKAPESHQEPPPPTKTQFATQFVNTVATEMGKQSAASISQPKAESKIKKLLDENDPQKEAREKYEIVMRKIVDYTEKYYKKSTYPFKDPNKLAKLPLKELEAELHAIQVFVNTQGADTIVKELCQGICGLLETIVKMSGNRYVNLEGFKENVKVGLDNGAYDEEIGQIVIEYAEWFARDPVTRLAYKIGAVGVITAKRNYEVKIGVAAPVIPNPEKFQKMNDQFSDLN